MSKHTSHPTDEQLNAFALGDLPPDVAARVEAHVGGCETCGDTIVGFAEDDTFLALLRNANSEFEPINDAIPAPLRDHPRYAIETLIGCGGMGTVYRARHRVMERPVALKLIHRELIARPEVVDRFHREMKSAASLDHPNIVTAHDAEQADDLHFLVMEYVDGQDLAEVVRSRGPLPVGEACEFIRQAAQGLQHAHENGMVHRDIKPHNLIVTEDGIVKILDFGLASLTPQLATESTPSADFGGELTIAGTIMGTPDFISPEQAVDARNVDGRSDIYSLGMTLYCLLAGHAPFPEGTARDKLKRHAESQPVPLSELRSDVPPELQRVFARMTAKDPAERFQSPNDVARELEGFAHLELQQRDRSWSSRKRAGFVCALLIAAAAVLLPGLLNLSGLRLGAGGSQVADGEDEPGLAEKAAANRKRRRDSLSRIGKALRDYHDEHGHFPARASRSEYGYPLLSWRVAILPHLGEKELYSRFSLHEPWDSEHNKKLLPLMPSVFQLAEGESAKKDRTQIVVPVVKGSMWVNRDNAQRTLKQLADGAANTMATLALPNRKGVVWTKPDDAAFTPESLKPTLFGTCTECSVGLFDGSVLEVHRDAAADDLVALVTTSGQEPLNLEDLLPPPSLRAPDPFGRNGKVDYLAHVNEIMLKKVPAEKNWPFAIAGWEQAAAEPKDGVLDQYYTIQGPWKAAEHPRIATWLTSQRAVLDRLVEASADAGCSVPLTTTRESYLEWMRPLMPKPDKSVNGVRTEIQQLLAGSYEYCSPLNWRHTLDDAGKVRNIARALRLRALLKIGCGEVSQALPDALALHRIARLVSRGMLDSVLVGCIIEHLACDVDQAMLAAGGLTKLECEQYLTALQEMNLLIDQQRCLEFRRAQVLDQIQFVSTKLGSEIDALTKAAPGAVTASTVDRLKRIDWSGVTRAFNRRLDSLIEAMSESDATVRRAQIEKLMTAQVEQDHDGLLIAIESASNDREIDRLIADHFYSLATGSLPQAIRSARSQTVVVKTACAVSVYRHRHGRFPKGLSELDRVLLTPAIDPFDGNPVRTFPRDERFLVYSVGENLVDQTHNEPSGEEVRNDDFVVRLQAPE